jgi:hypothetical protein
VSAYLTRFKGSCREHTESDLLGGTRRRRQFVSREEFTAMSRNAPGFDLDAFRADQDLAAEHDATDPYEQ